MKADSCLPDTSASMELAQAPGNSCVTLAPRLFSAHIFFMGEGIVSLKSFLLQNFPDKLEKMNKGGVWSQQ